MINNILNAQLLVIDVQDKLLNAVFIKEIVGK